MKPKKRVEQILKNTNPVPLISNTNYIDKNNKTSSLTERVSSEFTQNTTDVVGIVQKLLEVATSMLMVKLKILK